MRLILPIASSAVLSGCLEVEANSNVKDYDRHEWLLRWSGPDGDCQSTRHELLVQFSLAPVIFTNERGCTVDTGLWLDPYTGHFFGPTQGGGDWSFTLLEMNDLGAQLLEAINAYRLTAWCCVREPSLTPQSPLPQAQKSRFLCWRWMSEATRVLHRLPRS